MKNRSPPPGWEDPSFEFSPQKSNEIMTSPISIIRNCIPPAPRFQGFSEVSLSKLKLSSRPKVVATFTNPMATIQKIALEPNSITTLDSPGRKIRRILIVRSDIGQGAPILGTMAPNLPGTYSFPSANITEVRESGEQVVEIQVDKDDSSVKSAPSVIPLPLKQLDDGSLKIIREVLSGPPSPDDSIDTDSVTNSDSSSMIQEMTVKGQVDGSSDHPLSVTTKRDTLGRSHKTLAAITSSALPKLSGEVPIAFVGKSFKDVNTNAANGFLTGDDSPDVGAVNSAPHPSVENMSEQVEVSRDSVGFAKYIPDDYRSMIDTEGKGVKLWRCKLCGRFYGQHASLVNHLNIHQGYRPYKCPDCNTSFYYKATLTKHQNMGCRKRTT